MLAEHTEAQEFTGHPPGDATPLWRLTKAKAATPTLVAQARAVVLEQRPKEVVYGPEPINGQPVKDPLRNASSASESGVWRKHLLGQAPEAFAVCAAHKTPLVPTDGL